MIPAPSAVPFSGKQLAPFQTSKLDCHKARLCLTLVVIERLMPLLLLFELVVMVSVSVRMKLMTVEFSPGPGEVVAALSEVDEVLKVMLLEGLRASTLFNILNMFERVRGRLPQSSIAIEVALA